MLFNKAIAIKQWFNGICKKTKERKASEMIEFAIVVPLIFVVIFGMFDLGKILTTFTETGYYAQKELLKEVQKSGSGTNAPNLTSAATRTKEDLKNAAVFRNAIEFSSLKIAPSVLKYTAKTYIPAGESSEETGANKSINQGAAVCLTANVPIKLTMGSLFGFREGRNYIVNKTTCTIMEGKGGHI